MNSCQKKLYQPFDFKIRFFIQSIDIPDDEELKDDPREHLNIVFIGHVDAGNFFFVGCENYFLKQTKYYDLLRKKHSNLFEISRKINDFRSSVVANRTS